MSRVGCLYHLEDNEPQKLLTRGIPCWQVQRQGFGRCNNTQEPCNSSRLGDLARLILYRKNQERSYFMRGETHLKGVVGTALTSVLRVFLTADGLKISKILLLWRTALSSYSELALILPSTSRASVYSQDCEPSLTQSPFFHRVRDSMKGRFRLNPIAPVLTLLGD